MMGINTKVNIRYFLAQTQFKAYFVNNTPIKITPLMNTKTYHYLFKTFRLLTIILIASWVIYLVSNFIYLYRNPDIINEWGIFAIIGMMLFLPYQCYFLFWSGMLADSAKKAMPEHGIVQVVIIGIFGLIPSICVVIVSVLNAFKAFLTLLYSVF